MRAKRYTRRTKKQANAFGNSELVFFGLLLVVSAVAAARHLF